MGPRVLIDEASFTLQAGDKVGLVGKNGAGKTTLMKTLGGARTPAAGTLTRSGEHGYFSQEAHLERGRPDLDALERILEGVNAGIQHVDLPGSGPINRAGGSGLGHRLRVRPPRRGRRYPAKVASLER